MREFVYKAEGFRKVRAKQIRLFIVIFILVFLLAGVVPVFFNPERAASLPITFFVMLAVAATFMVNNISSQRNIYRTFKLTIDDSKIVVTRKKFPELTLLRSEVRSILKRANGNLVIRGKNQYYTIYIFPFIEGQDELEALLAAICPIRISSSSVNTLWFLPGVLLATGAIGSLAVTHNPAVRIIALTLLGALIAVGFFVSQANKKIDRTTRVLSWAILIPLIAFACYMLFG